MKRLLFIVLLLGCYFSGYAQNMSGYSTIYVPSDFKKFPENKYQLRELLSEELKDKGYQVTHDPEEARNCSTLRADIEDKSSLFKNKILLTFSDCHQIPVQEIKSDSSIKEYEEGFQDALKRALRYVGNYVPGSHQVQQQAEKQPTTPTAPEVPTGSVFTNKGISYQKVNIGNGKFILVKPGSTDPYATFEPTTKSGIYRVALKNLDMTLGYQENKNLVIELPNAEKSFIKEIFIGK